MKATIKSIKSIETLNIVEFELISNKILIMVSLELPDNINIGREVKLEIKPTNIIISKEFNNMISCDNRLNAKIIEVDNGQLLSSIKLDIEDEILESIITYNASKRIGLKIGDSVVVVIQASDLSISEIL